MADINAILQKKGVNNIRKESAHYEVTMIHYSQIIPSKMQFYAQEDIEEQADNIQLAGGIMQPLVVRKKDADQYELLAGHRRLQSIRLLVEERQLKQFAMVPCHVELANDWRAEYLLITTNGYREKSGYEKMMEVQRLTEIIPHLPGSEELKGRALRSRIARELKTGETSVQNYNYIAAHLCPEGMEAFREGRFKTATAFELSHLGPEDQKELLKQPELTSPIIAEYTSQKACQTLTPEKTQEEKKEETQIPGQREIEKYPEVLPENERKKSDTVMQKAEEESDTKEGVRLPDPMINQKLVARYLSYDPEGMEKMLNICRTGHSNEERAHQIQKLLAPNGYAGGSNANFEFLFQGYARGIYLKDGNDHTSMSYIGFVKCLETMYGPFVSEQNKPIAEEENQEPTIEQKKKILHDVITETQEVVDQMKEYWQENNPEQLWKNQLIIQAMESYLRELQ